MSHGSDWKATLASCQETLEKDPDHLGALETLAQAQWFICKYDDVISTTSRLLRLNPSEPGYRYTRGMAHLSKGELSLAVEDFNFAISLSNNEDFKRQVAVSLQAVEKWMFEGSARTSRFSAGLLGAGEKVN